MTVLIISNPVSGARNGPQFVEEKVIPLLQSSNLSYQLEETKEAGTAGRLAVEFLRKHEHELETHVIVVSGGDGTIHDLINGIGLSPSVVQLVICPQGTANALYSTLFPPSNNDSSTVEYQLRSLHAFLDGRSRHLTITETQILASDGQVTESVLGVVVASTALHASILDTAESLRASISGIDRFKVAAGQNISNWYHSHVRLQPSIVHGAHVRVYDPQAGTFKQLSTHGESIVDLAGPYEYFLSTVNVDRLEPTFETSPLLTKLPPGPGEMELIAVRPLRDTSLETDTPKGRAAFVHKSSTVLQGVYDRGAHISLRYAKDGTVGAQGDGPAVVEYIRCGGWEWIPDGSDPGAHLVCVDGTILNIPKGGKGICRVVADNAKARFRVCA